MFTRFSFLVLNLGYLAIILRKLKTVPAAEMRSYVIMLLIMRFDDFTYQEDKAHK